MATAQKKIPMRQCVGCREMKPKRELIRIVHSAEGNVNVDFSGRLPGRGAYVCRDTACLKKAMKAKALSHAFSCPVPDEVYDALIKEMEAQL